MTRQGLPQLSVRLGDKRYTIPAACVARIENIGGVTPLPFLTAAVDGLIYGDGRALLQIDVTASLGLASRPGQYAKRLIMAEGLAPLALRVDAVEQWLDGTTDHARACPPELPLADIWPQTGQSLSPQSKQKHPASDGIRPAGIVVLRVSSGTSEVSLLACNIERILKDTAAPVDTGLLPPEHHVQAARDAMAPSQSLARLTGGTTDVDEPYRIMIRGEQGLWALHVQQVKGMMPVGQVYSSGTAAAPLWYLTADGHTHTLMNPEAAMPTAEAIPPRLWYVDAAGQIQELTDADVLAGHRLQQPDIGQLEPACDPMRGEAKAYVAAGKEGGVSIHCDEACYFLPCHRVIHLGRYTDAATLSAARCSGDKTTVFGRLIPLIDLHRFLFGEPAKSPGHVVMLELSGQQRIGLVVERPGNLHGDAAGIGDWIPLALPAPLPRLFDGGFHDARTGRWILCMKARLTWTDLSWQMKKSWVKALLGWQPESR